MDSGNDATYLLRQDGTEACRLASQHLVWQLHTGYCLHPEIERKIGMKIADLGTGTGIWALELAPSLPPDSKIVGYDVSDSHLPNEEYWPSNVTFGILDSMTDVPEPLEGQFDVVHIRMWAYIPRQNDPSPLIRHAAKLLKPGGYLQWEDARFGSFVTRGDAARDIRNVLDCVNLASKFEFRWLEELDQHVKNAGVELEVVDVQYGTWAPHLRPLAISNSMLAMQNLGAALDNLKQKFPSIPSQAEWLNTLKPLDESIGKLDGGQLYWPPVTLLARKNFQA